MIHLYSYKKAYPYPLPKDTDKYDINDFVLAPEKPQILPDEKLEWTGKDWSIRTVSEVEVVFKQKEVRNRRDTLLSQSDWTQVADAPVDTAAWAVYRQSLRDVTSQSGFPWVVEWPAAPVNT